MPEGHGLPPRLLTRQAEALRQRLLHVPGVKKVDILGERPERIFVEFSYARLANLGRQRARHLRRAAAPERGHAGRLDRHQRARRSSCASTAPTTICRRSATRRSSRAAGRSSCPISPRSQRGYEDPATFLIRHNGEPRLVLGVVMQEGWNGLDLGKALEAEDDADLGRPARSA